MCSSDLEGALQLAQIIQKIYLGVNVVISDKEARQIINMTGLISLPDNVVVQKKSQVFSNDSDKERAAVFAILDRIRQRVRKRPASRFFKWVDTQARKEFVSYFREEVPDATDEDIQRCVSPIVSGLVSCIGQDEGDVAAAVLVCCDEYQAEWDGR